jgi:hypothetical protein
MTPNEMYEYVMTEQQMIDDGWRRCAVGQRTTQHCGMAEEVRAQEGDFYGGWITSDIEGPFKGGPGTRGW